MRRKGVKEEERFGLFYGFLRLLLRGLAWWYCRPRRLYWERIPRQGGVLIAPNHASRIDGALLLAYAPRRLTFLAAETNWKVRWLGWFLKNLGCIPVKPRNGNSGAVHTAARLLQEGKAVCIFPEGQVNRTLGELKAGVAILAATTGAPVIPVGISGSYEAMPPRQGLRRHPVVLAVGEAFRVSKCSLSRIPEEVIERINQELARRIGRSLQPVAAPTISPAAGFPCLAVA